MKTEDFSVILAQFGESLGIDGLCLDEYRSCTLGIDEVMLNLQWKEETETLFIYAPVGSLRDVADAPALYRRLLEANCLGADTAGFTLGILAGMETVVLSGQLFVQTLSVEQMTDFLTLFVEQTELWTTSLREEGCSRSTEAVSSESFAGTMLRI